MMFPNKYNSKKKNNISKNNTFTKSISNDHAPPTTSILYKNYLDNLNKKWYICSTITLNEKWYDEKKRKSNEENRHYYGMKMTCSSVFYQYKIVNEIKSFDYLYIHFLLVSFFKPLTIYLFFIIERGKKRLIFVWKWMLVHKKNKKKKKKDFSFIKEAKKFDVNING